VARVHGRRAANFRKTFDVLGVPVVGSQEVYILPAFDSVTVTVAGNRLVAVDYVQNSVQCPIIPRHTCCSSFHCIVTELLSDYVKHATLVHNAIQHCVFTFALFLPLFLVL
jgi:hypothetical protein